MIGNGQCRSYYLAEAMAFPVADLDQKARSELRACFQIHLAVTKTVNLMRQSVRPGGSRKQYGNSSVPARELITITESWT